MVQLKHPFCPNDSERSEYYGRHRGEGADIIFAGSDGAGAALQRRIRSIDDDASLRRRDGTDAIISSQGRSSEAMVTAPRPHHHGRGRGADRGPDQSIK